MKKILVPTDFSACSKAAENTGMAIAAKTGAAIHFLHIVPTPVEWAKLPLEKEKLYPETKTRIGRAKSELEMLADKAQKMGLKAEYFLIYDHGSAEIYQHILKHTDRHGIDFMVMGSHGANGFREVIGSNTQKVVRYAQVPMLAVKEGTTNFDVKNIVFAATFDEDVFKPFQNIMEFARLMGATIHLLFVNMPYLFKETDQIEKEMSAFLARCPKVAGTKNIYNAFDEERGIQKFAAAIGADLIALTTHGKTGFTKMLSPSITESLVNHSKIPVLSINMYGKE